MISRPVALSLLLSVLCGLLGCSVPNTVPSTSTPVASPLRIVQGSVHGGQQPIAGAAIQLYTIGYRVDGYPATPLLTQPVFTDANGGFDITGLFTCPDGSDIAYITATGGNPGLAPGTSNPNSAVMAMLDVCGILAPTTFINVNEVTTAAAVVSYGQFFAQYPNIGVAWTNAAPKYTSVLYFDQLVNYATGNAPGATFPANMQFPFPTLLSQANIIAACINSPGGTAGDNSSCGNLFALTTPPGGTAPTNTVDALVNMQRFPTQNVPQIFALAPPASPFQPASSTAPSDWFLRLTPGAPATPRYQLCTTWGDSLTQGSEDGTSVTIATTLATLPSCYWGNNQGVGGNTSTQIGIREGGLSSTATIAGGVIPASGPVNVSFPSGDVAPVTSAGPGLVRTVLSGVPGSISFDYNQFATVFTRDTPGAPTPSPANTPYSAVLTNENSGFVTLWAGRNDGTNQGALVLSNLNAMVAALPSPKHFVILSLINANDDGEYLGSGGYNLILATDRSIGNAYPDNYLDIRSLVVGSYDPNNPEDVLDHSHDIPPSSLRAIDTSGNLAANLDKSSCAFTVTGGAIYTYYTMNLEQEKIRILSSDGIHITRCIRGYAGTDAVAHAANTYFTGTDYLHLNHQADVIIANAVDAYIQAH